MIPASFQKEKKNGLLGYEIHYFTTHSCYSRHLQDLLVVLVIAPLISPLPLTQKEQQPSTRYSTRPRRKETHKQFHTRTELLKKDLLGSPSLDETTMRNVLLIFPSLSLSPPNYYYHRHHNIFSCFATVSLSLVSVGE